MLRKGDYLVYRAVISDLMDIFKLIYFFELTFDLVDGQSAGV